MNLEVIHNGITYHCSFPATGLIGIRYTVNGDFNIPLLNTIDISILAIKKSLSNWTNLPIPIPVKEQVERIVKLWAFR